FCLNSTASPCGDIRSFSIFVAYVPVILIPAKRRRLGTNELAIHGAQAQTHRLPSKKPVVQSCISSRNTDDRIWNVDLSSCQVLSCNPPNGSICSPGDMPGPEIGVGIAANTVNASGTNLSFTLIDGLDANGFTAMASEEYELSDQQLFVGIDTDSDYPSGCALMMQYQGQTFPTELLPGEDDAREVQDQNTTSCDGVLAVFCQSAIVNII